MSEAVRREIEQLTRQLLGDRLSRLTAVQRDMFERRVRGSSGVIQGMPHRHQDWPPIHTPHRKRTKQS